MSAPPVAPSPAATEPFVGPRAFQATDVWRFFGRDREVADLVDIVTAARIVLLYSPSGAGKSSLINAALIPRLEERFRALPVISVAAPPPTDGPPVNRYLRSAMLSIENALPEPDRMPAGELDLLDFPTYLARRHDLDDDLARRRGAVPDERPELLVFDQFEEILSIDPLDLDAKTAFFEQVGEALRDRQRWAIFSMREEYDARLDPYRRFVPAGLSTRFRLDLLGADAAIQAIWRPTSALPVKITVDAAEKIVDDLSRVQGEQAGEGMARHGSHVDPVQLQVVCLRLWEKRAPGATEITAADIDRTGTNVDVALGEYYDETVARAAEQAAVPEREIRAWIGDHLITRHGLRNRVLREPGESRGLPDRAIELLLDRYLLRTAPGDAAWVELAHDRLVPPVRQSNEAWLARHLSPLQRHAEAWARGGRVPDLLVKGARLREMRAWAEEQTGQVTPTEREFLAASAAASNASFKRLALLATAIACAAILLTVWALVERNRAEDARDAADAAANDSRVQALVAQAPDQHDSGDDERGALLARQAYLFDTPNDGDMDGLVDGSLRTVLSQPGFSVLLDHGYPVVAAVIGNDGTMTTVTGPLNVVTSDDYRPITVWRWNVHDDEVERTDYEWTGTALTAIAIDPDGTRLAAGSRDGTILMWDLAAAGDAADTIRESGPSVGALAFSADGGRLAVGDADGGVYLWDVSAPGEEPEPLPASTVGITGLAFSSDGGLLASGGADGTVNLWDTAGGLDPLTLRGHRGPVGTLAFSPDGSLLATASSDATTRLWEIPSGEARGQPIPSTQALAFSPDGATVAIGQPDSSVALFDPGDLGAAPAILSGHRDAILTIAFSPDGAMLATGSGDGTARAWTIAAAAEPDVVVEGSATPSATSGALIPDGETSVSLLTLGTDGVVSRGSEVVARPGALGRGSGISAVAVSPDGSLLATGTTDGKVRLIDLKQPGSGTDLPSSSRRRVTALAFSPDGSRLAIGATDGTVRLVPLAGDDDEIVLSGSRGDVSALAIGPDGRVAGGGIDGSVRVWDPARPDAPVDVEATGDIDAGIRSLAFSADGTVLAFGDDDGVTHLVGAAHLDAEPIVLRSTAGGPVIALAFGADGDSVYTAHADGSVRSWIARTDILAGMVCQQVRRNLTAEEWDRYVGLPLANYQSTCEDFPPGVGAPGGHTPVAGGDG